MRRILPSISSIIAVILLCVSALSLLEALKPQEPILAAPSAPDMPTAEPQQEKGVSPEMPTDITQAAARPLFSPSRRVPEIVSLPEVSAPEPVAPPPPPVEVPIIEPPAISMIGILEDNGQLKALIKGEDRDERWVAIGAEIDGWRVRQITPLSITLQLNGESVDIYAVD